MSATITQGAATISPRTVSGYLSDREAGNILHWVQGRAYPDVTTRPAKLRTGTLTLTFDSETASKTAEDMHAEGGVFALASTERTTVNMAYVVAERGRISRQLDPAGVWILTVDYQEVVA